MRDGLDGDAPPVVGVGAAGEAGEAGRDLFNFSIEDLGEMQGETTGEAAVDASDISDALTEASVSESYSSELSLVSSAALSFPCSFRLFCHLVFGVSSESSEGNTASRLWGLLLESLSADEEDSGTFGVRADIGDSGAVVEMEGMGRPP